MIKQLYICKETGFDPYHNIATEKYILDTLEPGDCVLYLKSFSEVALISDTVNVWTSA